MPLRRTIYLNIFLKVSSILMLVLKLKHWIKNLLKGIHSFSTFDLFSIHSCVYRVFLNGDSSYQHTRAELRIKSGFPAQFFHSTILYFAAYSLLLTIFHWGYRWENKVLQTSLRVWMMWQAVRQADPHDFASARPSPSSLLIHSEVM